MTKTASPDARVDQASSPGQVGRATAAWLIGAGAWGAHLLAIYVAWSILCRDGHHGTAAGIELGDAVVLAITVAASIPVALALGRDLARRRRRTDADADAELSADGGPTAFTIDLGIALNAYFLWAIVLEGIVVVFLGPCP